MITSNMCPHPTTVSTMVKCFQGGLKVDTNLQVKSPLPNCGHHSTNSDNSTSLSDK